jgi:hypothetical protein
MWGNKVKGGRVVNRFKKKLRRDIALVKSTPMNDGFNAEDVGSLYSIRGKYCLSERLQRGKKVMRDESFQTIFLLQLDLLGKNTSFEDSILVFVGVKPITIIDVDDKVNRIGGLVMRRPVFMLPDGRLTIVDQTTVLERI